MTKAKDKTADNAVPQDQKSENLQAKENKPPVASDSAITVLTAFSASENGTVVDHYPAGQHESLPPTAAKYAIATGAVSEEDAAKLAESLEQESQDDAKQ